MLWSGRLLKAVKLNIEDHSVELVNVNHSDASEQFSYHHYFINRPAILSNDAKWLFKVSVQVIFFFHSVISLYAVLSTNKTVYIGFQFFSSIVLLRSSNMVFMNAGSCSSLSTRAGKVTHLIKTPLWISQYITVN